LFQVHPAGAAGAGKAIAMLDEGQRLRGLRDRRRRRHRSRAGTTCPVGFWSDAKSDVLQLDPPPKIAIYEAID